jgi:hypothetical protein
MPFSNRHWKCAITIVHRTMERWPREAYAHFKQSRKASKDGAESFTNTSQEESKLHRGESPTKRKAMNDMKQTFVQTGFSLSHVERRASRGKFEQVHEGEGDLQITCG